MPQRAPTTARLVLVALAFGLGGCGGGGGGGGTTGPGPTPPPTEPTWTSGSYQAPTQFAAMCAVPRSGTDPSTGKPFRDKLGSAVWENHWLRAWTHAYYLWYAEVADVNPSGHTTPSYFDLMKTTQTTPTGRKKDQFHFTFPSDQWYALATSGVQVGYGASWALIATTPPRKLLVAYTDPGTPATQAGLVRGAEILAIDGVDLVNDNTQAGINTLNAGLAPAKPGESHSFVVVDAPGVPSRSVTLVSQNITSTPVQNVRTVVQPGGVVGYMQFNDHVATAEAQLIAAFNQLATAAVSDLVLDLRYNGGGYLDIASEVAYMIAGPGATTNRTFELASFNDKYPTTNPITGAPLTPTPFHSTSQGFSTTAGQALPHLDLARVFVLTSNGTCSASESIINGLRGVGITVIEVGSDTCGKPYGFYPEDNCGTTYFSIELKGVNDAGFGDYTDGFYPSNSPNPGSVALAGCSVADDYAHALGDPNEAEFAAALAFRQGGQGACPAASGNSAPRALAAAIGRVPKPDALMNRIMRHAQ